MLSKFVFPLPPIIGKRVSAQISKPYWHGSYCVLCNQCGWRWQEPNRLKPARSCFLMKTKIPEYREYRLQVLLHWSSEMTSPISWQSQPRLRLFDRFFVVFAFRAQFFLIPCGAVSRDSSQRGNRPNYPGMARKVSLGANRVSRCYF